MRKLWLSLLLLGCGGPYVDQEIRYVNAQTKYLTYFKDPRTGYCFAVWRSYHGSASWVPCEGIPDHLLNRNDR